MAPPLQEHSISSVSMTPLHRRPRQERQVLSLIRTETRGEPGGEDSLTAIAGDSAAHWLFFAQLRQLAQDNGLAIQAPGCPYVGTDELQLLAWVARAQRYKAYRENFHADERLTRSIFLCAGLLAGQGISLPSVTMLTRIRSARSRRRASIS